MGNSKEPNAEEIITWLNWSPVPNVQESKSPTPTRTSQIDNGRITKDNIDVNKNIDSTKTDCLKDQINFLPRFPLTKYREK